MKTFFTTLLASLLCCTVLHAQQAQEEERTPIPYEYPAFKDATVTMMFGTQKHVKGNIYLDGSKFYFMQEDKNIEADLGNIRQVSFGDTLYVVMNQMMARVVARDSSKMLVCVKTIDTYEMEGRKDGFGGRDQSGEGLPYFQVDINGVLGMIELNNAPDREKARQFPLKRDYYFILDGDIVPAKEQPVLGRYDEFRQQVLKGLTENRFWSWKDERSLAQLLQLL